jgi:hypothetical protein
MYEVREGNSTPNRKNLFAAFVGESITRMIRVLIRENKDSCEFRGAKGRMEI